MIVYILYVYKWNKILIVILIIWKKDYVDVGIFVCLLVNKRE